MMPSAAVYARMHRKYLETAHPKVFKEMKASGELTEHVAKAGQRALQMYEAMEAQMMRRINEQNLDYPQKVKELKQIPHVVEEIVLHDVVYSL